MSDKIWQAKSAAGRKPLFNTPEMLWDAAAEYFAWADRSPLKEQRVFAYKGEITKTDVEKMRPYTIGGMCLYLDIDPQTFKNYKAREQFFGICTKIENIIYEQKFAGAAADLMNPVIIARDLGLKDRVSVDDSKEVQSDKEKRRTRIEELLNKFVGGAKEK